MNPEIQPTCPLFSAPPLGGGVVILTGISGTQEFGSFSGWALVLNIYHNHLKMPGSYFTTSVEYMSWAAQRFLLALVTIYSWYRRGPEYTDTLVAARYFYTFLVVFSKISWKDLSFRRSFFVFFAFLFLKNILGGSGTLVLFDNAIFIFESFVLSADFWNQLYILFLLVLIRSVLPEIRYWFWSYVYFLGIDKLIRQIRCAIKINKGILEREVR